MVNRMATLLLLVIAIPAAAEDGLAWAQFRGPGGSGVADDEKPPTEIGPDKNVKWKVAAPAGLSSPIVAGDLLVMTAVEEEKLFTIAYNRADGSEAWRAEAPTNEFEAYHKTEGSPAASTPATDGKHIVSYFGSCGLFCYDLQGKELWHKTMPPAVMPGSFGSGTSPVIADGMVVLLRDEAMDPKIMALDVATGEVKWEHGRESRSGYCTPVVWETAEGKQVAAPGFGRMIGYDLASGGERWSVAGMPSSSCASPVVVDGILYFAAWSPGDPSEGSDFRMADYDQLIAGERGDTDGDGILSKAEAEKNPYRSFFAANDRNGDGMLTREEWNAMLEYISASRNSAFALRPGGTGDITETHVIWKQTKGLPYVPSAIVYMGQQLMVKDGGVVTAYDTRTGKELYQKRVVASGGYYASPVAAGGNIYFASLDDGTVTVLKGGSEKGEVVAKNSPLDERLVATPAIADDTLYVRTAGHLYAFAEE